MTENYLNGNINPRGTSVLNLIVVNLWERRSGIGSKMLQEFEDKAKKAGSTGIRVLIMPPEGESKVVSINFFSKHGYDFEAEYGDCPFYIKKL